MTLRYKKDLNLKLLRLSNELCKNPPKKILKHKVRLEAKSIGALQIDLP